MLELSFRRRPSIRFAYSPLWEIVAEVRACRTAELARSAGRLRDEAGLPCADFEVFVELVRGEGEYIPDLLAPPPTAAPEPKRFEDELDRIAAVAEETVRAQLEAADARRSGRSGGRSRLRALADDPPAVLDVVVRCYAACWTRIARRVYYERSRRGEQLLALFSE